MCQSFANTAAIGDRFDMEDNTSVKAPTALRYVISREYLQEWSVENGLGVAPDLLALLEWLAKSVLSMSIVRL